MALVKGRPRILNLRDLISEFVEFRHEVVVRRTKFELRKAEERAHILEGYIIALDNLDAVIKLIRESATPNIAQEGLMMQVGDLMRYRQKQYWNCVCSGLPEWRETRSEKSMMK